MDRFQQDKSVKAEEPVNISRATEEHRKATEVRREAEENARKTYLSMAFFLIAAIIAIIIITAAWFLSNNTVSMTGVRIGANGSEQFLIASAGTRSGVEQEQYKENGENILSDTEGEPYDGYYDTLTGENVTLQEENKLVLYKGTAWHLQDHGTMQPGARGVLEFYVIPQVDGLRELTFTLDTIGFQKASGTERPVEPVQDSVLTELLKGHILFFTKLDDKNGYSGWLGTDEKRISVTDKRGELQNGLPYKVSIYWIWPRRYRNFIYHQKATEGDLFTTESSDYLSLISYMNSNRTQFFYNKGSSISEIVTGMNMEDADYALGASYYNMADEYIGNHMNYIYLEVKP